MEIIVGIGGLVIAVLLWLFPPEPLRRLLGVAPSAEETAQQHCDLVRRFSSFLQQLPEVESGEFQKRTIEASLGGSPPPSLIDRQEKPRLLHWLDALDDELLLLTRSLASCGGAGTTQRWLAAHSHPLGKGRGVEQLIDALLQVGVLAPTTEELVPRTYAEIDAKSNPSFDYGEMLYTARYYIALGESQHVFTLHSHTAV